MHIRVWFMGYDYEQNNNKNTFIRQNDRWNWMLKWNRPMRTITTARPVGA